MQTVPNISEDLVPFIGSLALSMMSAAQVPAASSPLLSIRGNPAGVIRCQFVFSGVIRYRFIFSGVIRYRFIFSGKNAELTPDFRAIENRVLVHPNCHQQIHSQEIDVGKPRPAKGVREA